MKPSQLAAHVIEPTLKHLGLYSEAAVQLLLLTSATESEMGDYLAQYPKGPARGIYQIETETEFDVHTNFLAHQPALRSKVMDLLPTWQDGDPLIGNLFYATAIARVIYWRAPEPMPAAGDWPALAAFYKKRFNTPRGEGSVEKFLADGKRFSVIKDEE